MRVDDTRDVVVWRTLRYGASHYVRHLLRMLSSVSMKSLPPHGMPCGYIHFDQPELVIEAINHVLDAQ